MSLKTLMLATAALCLVPSAGHAEVLASKGVGTVALAGSRASPAERDRARLQAEENALDRYIAENNPAKQRIYDGAKTSILQNIGDYVLGITVLAENTDNAAHTYTVSVRADINSNALENKLSDSVGQAPARNDGRDIMLVFVSRNRTSVQSFDDHVYSRNDAQSQGGCKSNVANQTREGERVRRGSVGTSDSAKTSFAYDCRASDVTESGGSTTRKADKVAWAVSEAADFDQQITGAMADSGYNLVPAEYVEKVDLTAIRSDYARGDDVAAPTLRSLVGAAKAAGLPYVVIGTMTIDMPDRDPVTGNVREFVSINAKLLDVTGAYPRPSPRSALSSILGWGLTNPWPAPRPRLIPQKRLPGL